MRKMQLELYDSGLLPESMRVQRARDNGVTIYEMVRNPKFYPLAAYLDAADAALARDKANLPALVKAMSSKDAGMRYWAVVGLHLLGKGAAPAMDVLTAALEDDEHEVRMMAAWTVVKLGKPNAGLTCLGDLLNNGTAASRKLCNVLDWMGPDAVPLVREYLATHPKEAKNILAKIAQDHGIPVPKPQRQRPRR